MYALSKVSGPFGRPIGQSGRNRQGSGSNNRVISTGREKLPARSLEDRWLRNLRICHRRRFQHPVSGGSCLELRQVCLFSIRFLRYATDLQ